VGTEQKTRQNNKNAQIKQGSELGSDPLYLCQQPQPQPQLSLSQPQLLPFAAVTL